ncbi:MAG: geranylgeranylglycerol-phosphate geranylgeranyltransferase [Candidatus Aenigmatarchaeota archaeon]
MNPYLELIRPTVCGLSAFGIIIGGIVAGTAALSVTFALAVVAAFVICAAGNVINDWFDWQADKINAPKKPIPSGHVSRRSALRYYAVLSAIGIATACLVSSPFFAIALLNWLVASAYSCKLKPMPLIKNISVSWLGASTFLAAGLITGFALPIGILLLFAVSFLVTLAREIIKDVEDVKGDEAVGLKTLPMLFGIRMSKIFAYLLLLIGCALLLAPFCLDIFSVYYFIGAVPAVLLCIRSLKSDAHGARVKIKVAMYLAFLAFLLGSLM